MNIEIRGYMIIGLAWDYDWFTWDDIYEEGDEYGVYDLLVEKWKQNAIINRYEDELKERIS